MEWYHTGSVRPLLFELSLPSGLLPLFVIWGALAAMGAFLAFLGRRAGERRTVALGAALGAVGVSMAVASGSRRYEGGAYPVYGYGALLGVGLAAGWWLATRAARRTGLRESAVSKGLLAAIAGGLVGARAVYLVCNAREASPADLFVWSSGGMSLHGGLAFGVAAAAYVARRERISLLELCDAAAPGVCAALCVGWLGSYLAGSDYGCLLDADAPRWLRLLGTFPRWTGPQPLMAGSPAFVDHVAHRGLDPAREWSLPVHPTQLYEAVLAAALFVGVLWLRGRQSFRGAVCLAALGVYGVLRFALETLRGDPERGTLGPLSVPQWFAAASVVVAGWVFSRLLATARTLQTK